MTGLEIMNRASAIIDDLSERPDDSDFSTAKREICRLVEDAISAEREDFAKITEDMPVTQHYCVGRDLLTVDDATATKRAIAEAIRARGVTESAV